MDEIDPRTIFVDREKRQRQEDLTKNIEELKASIKRNGIINPITVRHIGDYIVLVAGERRLTAALALGLTTVPVRFLEDLDKHEAEIIELEENIKRHDLSWRDKVRAIGRIHAIHKTEDVAWSMKQTAEDLGYNLQHTYRLVGLSEYVDDSRLAAAETAEQAMNILARFAERKAEAVVSDIIASGEALFAERKPTPRVETNAPQTTQASAQASVTETSTLSVIHPALDGHVTEERKVSQVALAPVVCSNFHLWAATYAGPKFSFIHCDFPYGNYRGSDTRHGMIDLETEEFYDNTESVYWTLVDSLIENLDRLMSYSAHLMFWFSMTFYTETVAKLRAARLDVQDYPLIWHKSDGFGASTSAVTGRPRRTYDTALLASRGKKPLVRVAFNSYAAPTVRNKIHPSQKPEPMLRHFFSMLVDETTSMLDPTCGSGASLRAAEDLKARSVVGLELDPNYAKSANDRTLQARLLREAGKIRSEDMI